VGRGMRLCVNKNGERQDAEVLGDAVFDINILTIIASESYDQFAKKLQTEIADACGDRPVLVTSTLFAGHVFVMEDGSEQKIDEAKAVEINNVLVFHQYIDMKGQLTQKYFDDKKDGKLDFGELNNMKNDIVRVLDTVFDPGSIPFDNGRKPREAHFDEKKFKNEFIDLWNRINVRTVYTVDFKSEDLIKKAIKDIDDMLSVTVIRMMVGSGSLENIRDKESLKNGTAMTDAKMRRIDMKESVGGSVRYDLVGRIVEATGLTRRTIVTILKGISTQKFAMYRQNPEEFIIKISKIINDCKASAVIEQIRYEKTSQKFDADIFTEATIRGKLGVNAIESSKSLYDLVVVDSQGIEKHFAEELEKESDVKVYTKLPRGFYINTPMGHYNPDWAIVFNEGATKHIYFVAETKGNDEIKSELRGVEESKIECARRHFNAISKAGDVKYDVVKTYQKLYDLVAK
jgi:type III restriction enzyme